MALTFSNDIRDQVCLILKGRVYSDCSTADQTAIAGTEGAGPRALAQIQQWAHFFEMAGSDVAPEAWKRWLIHLSAAEAAQFMRPDRESDLRRLAIEAQRDALRTFARSEIDGTAPDDLADTNLGVRKHVVSRCTRLEPMVLPEPDVVDTAIKWTINRVWNDAHWRFTQKIGVISIAANGTVTVADESEVALSVDQVIGDQLYYAAGEGLCLSVDSEYILRERSEETRQSARPAFFHLQKSGSSISWLFAPEPDQAYTARALFKIRTPSMTTSAEIDAALALFPHEFQQIIRDMAYAKVLYDFGRPEGQAFLRAASDDLGGLAPGYGSPGGVDERSRRGQVRPRGLGPTPRYLGGNL